MSISIANAIAIGKRKGGGQPKDPLNGWEGLRITALEDSRIKWTSYSASDGTTSGEYSVDGVNFQPLVSGAYIDIPQGSAIALNNFKLWAPRNYTSGLYWSGSIGKVVASGRVNKGVSTNTHVALFLKMQCLTDASGVVFEKSGGFSSSFEGCTNLRGTSARLVGSGTQYELQRCFYGTKIEKIIIDGSFSADGAYNSSWISNSSELNALDMRNATIPNPTSLSKTNQTWWTNMKAEGVLTINKKLVTIMQQYFPNGNWMRLPNTWQHDIYDSTTDTIMRVLKDADGHDVHDADGNLVYVS